MWIFLTITILIVIGCIIFGVYCLISSRTVQKVISGQFKTVPAGIPKRSEISFPVLHQQQNFVNLKTKLKSIEKNSVEQVYQLSRLEKRIETLEEEGSLKVNQQETKWDDTSEDWEKLYYETRKEKNSLEEDLTLTKDTLNETQRQLEELKKEKANWVEMKSEVNTRLNEIHSLQNIIEELQRKLESADEREKELQLEITSKKYLRTENEMLEKENSRLQSEADELADGLTEMKLQNDLMRQKIKRLTEFESLLRISEYEKMEIKNSVAQIITEM